MWLADPMTVIKVEDIPVNRWARKAKFLFNEESLPDLNWQKHYYNRKQLTNTYNCEPAKDGAKLCSNKSPLENPIDVQDAA